MYNEKYRNQFHFSPLYGWMNDINGCWYQNGVYHMTYQARSEETDNRIGWGYATSPDMIHWEKKPMALFPGKNTVGDAWSGSVVIDRNNTAGFGENIPILIYTDASRGQCLNYWDEQTQSFAPYDKNPVISMDAEGIENGLLPHEQRDPKVIWDEKSGRWVAFVFRDSLTGGGCNFQIYASLDLKNWERLEDFNAEGYYECPAIYPLMLDEKEEKWIIQSASGRYAVGHFDGNGFVIEQDNHKRLFSGHIYAGQTFMNLPDNKTVFVYWMDDYSGSTVVTEPWMNFASLPYELSLKTLPDGTWHIFGTPIEQTELLHGEKILQVKDKVLSAGENLLKKVDVRYADLTLLFDLSDATAENISMNFRGKKYDISLQNKEITTETHSVITPFETDNGDGIYKTYCPVRNGMLKLRVLIDADCVDLIIGDGENVYLEEFGFEPERLDWSVTADGSVKISEAFGFEMNSAY